MVEQTKQIELAVRNTKQIEKKAINAFLFRRKQTIYNCNYFISPFFFCLPWFCISWPPSSLSLSNSFSPLISTVVCVIHKRNLILMFDKDLLEQILNENKLRCNKIRRKCQIVDIKCSASERCWRDKTCFTVAIISYRSII